MSSPESKSEKIPSKIFLKGKGFLADAISYLKSEGVKPEWGKNYIVRPGSEVYFNFLNFLIEEMKALPFENEMGNTIDMRGGDAKEVIKQLTEYLEKKKKVIAEGGVWDPVDIEEIADIFSEFRLEVFKNEIYPSHAMDGMGYNVDLSIDKVENAWVPGDIKFERRYISNTDGFKVLDQGFINIALHSGRMHLDLDEWPTRNVHRGD